MFDKKIRAKMRKFDKTIKRVIILGCYGFRNTGDEAILSGLINSLKKVFPHIEITVFSGDPEYTKATHKVDAVNRIEKFPCIFKDFLKRIRYIKNCNLLIIGGGGLYNDIWHKMPYGFIELVFAKMFNKKVAICGVDIGPYHSTISKILAKFFFNMVDLITVRSKGSMKELRNMRINALESADLAFLIKGGDKNKAEELLKDNKIPTENLIGISMTSIQLEKRGKSLNFISIAKTLDKFLESTDKSLLFIPFQYQQDIEISRKIINLMENRKKVYLWDKDSNFIEINDIISNLDFMIGMRLHSNILAAINEIPFLAISYNPKVKNFCEMFTEILPYLELQDIKSSDNFYNMLIKTYQNRKKFKEIISSDIQFLMEKASTTIKVLSGIID